MRSLPISLAVLMVFVALAGCQKSEAPPQRTAYDETLDGKSPLAMPILDESLTRSGPSGRATAAPATAAATPAVASTGDAVKDVQAVLVEMVKAAKSDKPETMADFLVPEIAKVMGPLLIADKKQSDAKKKAEEAIRAKLGDATVAKLKDLLKEGAGGESSAPGGDFEQMDPAQMKLELVGQEVKVSDAAGEEQVVFKQVNGKWLASMPGMPPGQAQIIESLSALFAKVSDAYTEVYTALADGVTAGTITADTFDTQTKQLAEQKIKPAAAALLPAMMMAMASMQATSGPASGPAEAGGATPPPAEIAPVLTTITQAIGGETPETASESFIPEQASMFTTFFNSQKNYRLAQKALETALTAKLTATQVQQLHTALADVTAVNPLPLTDMASAKFQSAAGEYRFRDAESKKLEMVVKQPAGKWLVGFPDPAKQLPALTSYGELLTAATTMMQSITTEVSGGMPAEAFYQSLSVQAANLTPAIEAVKKAVTDAAPAPATVQP